ncbi:MAG: sigma-54 dependent transcriptional regulator [Lentisphaeraceae bacterium]|nr:sigma-54 dependent transcriptional regulator [Lentisphaeraceae bacterium]
MNIKIILKKFEKVNRIEHFLPLLAELIKPKITYGKLVFNDEFFEVGGSEDVHEYSYVYKKSFSLKLVFAEPVTNALKENLDLFCGTVLNNLVVISKLRKVSYKGWASKNSELEPVAESESMKECLYKANMVAAHKTTVLLQGETGVGKEVIAKYIHDKSEQKSSAFVTVNCAALPDNLIDSALFGHVKGAFTGADKDRRGFFDKAKGGTLFLDEVGELPLETQSRLLRVLEYGDYTPLGSDEPSMSDVRVIAASHVSLKQAVLQGDFRQDLFFRLSIFPIYIPSLRERKDDICALIDQLLSELYLKLKVPRKKLSSKFYESALQYQWPGNVRELKNTLEKSLILSKNNTLKLQIESNDVLFAPAIMSFDEEVKSIIDKALAKSGGKVDGPGGAAEILGLKPQTLYSKIRKYGMKAK